MPCAHGDQSPKIADLLRARAQSWETLQAQMIVSYRAGADLESYDQDQDVLEQYFVRKGMMTVEELEEERKLRQRPFTMVGECLRYYATRNGPLRMERFGEPVNGQFPQSVKPSVTVWTGDRWKNLVPAGRFQPGRAPMMQVHLESGKYPPTEVFCGNALPLNVPLCRELGLERDAAVLAPNDQLGWVEAVSRFPMERAVESVEPLPRGGPALPMLELQTSLPQKAPASQWGMPGRRVRIWLDPAQDYCPVRCEVDFLEPDEVGGNHRYIHRDVVEWSDFVRLPSGFVLASHCTEHVYLHFSLPSGDENRTPAKAYNTKDIDAVLSNVRINEPLAKSLFDVVPPTGTHVRDDVVGYAYLVGSAGEELEKIALAEPQPSASGVSGRWSSWTLALSLLTGLFIAVALGYGTWRVARRYREKSK
jgi:hypothetical protein